MRTATIPAVAGACLLVVLLAGTASAAVSAYVGVQEGQVHAWTGTLTYQETSPNPRTIQGSAIVTMKILAIGNEYDFNATMKACKVNVTITINSTYPSSANITGTPFASMTNQTYNLTYTLKDNPDHDPITTFFNWLINKNANNKTVPPFTMTNGMTTTGNAQWNANGLLFRMVYKMNSSTASYEQVYSLGGLIPGYTPALVLLAAALAVPLVASRLRKRVA